MTAPAYVTATSNGTNSGTTVATTIPVACSVGDLIMVLCTGVSGTVTPPAGASYLPLPMLYAGTLTFRGTGYYKFAEAGDINAAQTWTFDGAAAAHGVSVVVYTGVNTVTPFGDVVKFNNNASGNQSFLGVYPLVADSLIVSCFVFDGLQDEFTLGTGLAANYTKRTASGDYRSTGAISSGFWDNATDAASASRTTAVAASTLTVAGSSNYGFLLNICLNPATQTDQVVMGVFTGAVGGSPTANLFGSSGTLGSSSPSRVALPGVFLYYSVVCTKGAHTYSNRRLNTNSATLTTDVDHDHATESIEVESCYKMLTGNDCDIYSTGLEYATITSSGSINYASMGVAVAFSGGTIVESLVEDATLGTTPNPSSIASEVGGVVVTIKHSLGGAYDDPTAPSGYTDWGGRGSTATSTMRIDMASIEAADVTEDPGAWSGATSDDYSLITFSLSVASVGAVAASAGFGASALPLGIV